MTYSEAQSMIDDVKAFCRAQKRIQDKRRKTYELVSAQLDDAYRVLCVASNHIRTAERHDKTKGK